MLEPQEPGAGDKGGCAAGRWRRCTWRAALAVAKLGEEHRHLRGARRELPRARELLWRRDHVDQEVAGARLVALERPQLGLRRVPHPLIGGIEAARVVFVVDPVLESLALEKVGLREQLRARRCRQARALEASAQELQEQPEEAWIPVDEIPAFVVERMRIVVREHQREVRAATRHQQRVSMRVKLRAAHI